MVWMVVGLVWWTTASVLLVEATNVQWTAADNKDPNNAAHTAPRSQKYWDENGIKRPDYAKTDAELAQEKRGVVDPGSSGGSNFGALFLLLLSVVVGVVYFQVQKREQGGYKLGGASSRRISEEDARQARLAKFE